MKQPTKPHGCGKGGKKYVVKCKAERTGGAFSFLFFSFFPSGRRLIYIYTILSPSPLNQPLTVVTRSHPPTKPPGTGEREERRGRNVQSDSEIALCSEFSTFVGRKRGVKKKESKTGHCIPSTRLMRMDVETPRRAPKAGEREHRSSRPVPPSSLMSFRPMRSDHNLTPPPV